MRFAGSGLLALVVACSAGAIGAPGASARTGAASSAGVARPIDARAVGTFAMLARVTAAVNVRGERVGERLARTWTLLPRGCNGSVCQLMQLDRERGGGKHAGLTLHRVGSGRYYGQGVFYAALSCLGRVEPLGSRVPYRITLAVRGVTMVQGIRFARQLTATYVNPKRSDATRCPLGPSHDAARYTGRAISPVPSPPTASFSAIFSSASDTAAYTDTSRPGTGGAVIVSRLWTFGDSASGSANGSTLVVPVHHFSAPGIYVVSLTVTDANGLSATDAQLITAPGPPNASFTATQPGQTALLSFADDSTAGIGGAPIVAWHWDFGDPGSGTLDVSTAQNPSHTFSAPGDHPVTLTVTDANGFTSSTSRQVVSPP